ncbi:MAG: CoA-binding protein, partial [Rhodospirillales bacterium]
MSIRNFTFLLRPRSVALIGASPRPGSVGNVVLRNLLAGGFKGPVWAVNPRHAAIDGKPCFADIAALPQAPDLAVIATPPQSIPAIVGDLGARGTKAAVVITAGLDEAQRRATLEAARPHLLRVVGPNCLGVAVPGIGLDATFAHAPPLAGDLAFVTQSGAIMTAIVDWTRARGIGLSHLVSLGDMADADFGDMLDYLGGDGQVRAILLYIEAVTNARKFMSAARSAARLKPVVAIKAGRHEAG